MDSIVSNILNNAKLAYKEIVISDNEVIQELLLSILADSKRLQGLKINSVSTSVPRERVTLDRERSADINTIAYIFSEYEHTSLFPNLNQTQAFKEVSKILNVKQNTFTNKRDAFDKFTNSMRVGWDKELSQSMQDIFDKLSGLSENEVISIANNILQKYI